MKLKSLLNGIEGLKAKGNLDTDVKGITHNSKNVKEGDMFIAIKGFDTDGHKYIKDAVENGAKVIVIQEGETIKKSDKKIYITGHSKGGNLALVSAYEMDSLI